MATETYGVNEMLADAYEPKRQNRWVFELEGIPSFIARTATLPSFSVEPITIDFLNTKRYIAGKFEWNTITLGLYDPIAPSASQKVMEWARLGYENLSGHFLDFDLLEEKAGIIVQDYYSQNSIGKVINNPF